MRAVDDGVTRTTGGSSAQRSRREQKHQCKERKRPCTAFPSPNPSAPTRRFPIPPPRRRCYILIPPRATEKQGPLDVDMNSAPADAKQGPHVGLFVTCLVDLFRPSVGLRRRQAAGGCGRVVEVPRAQTCCGQPAYNSGDRADAPAIARQVVELSSGSIMWWPHRVLCRHAAGHYPALLADDPAFAERAEALAAKTLRADELPGRRARRRGASMRALPVASPITIPAPACASSASRRAAPPAGQRRWPEPRGAGRGRGLLRLRRRLLRQISRHLRLRSARRQRTSPRPAPRRVLAGDLGCLMQIAGKLSRARGADVEARHVAEVLAGMTEAAGHRPAAVRGDRGCGSTSRRKLPQPRGECASRARRRRAAARAAERQAGFRCQAGGRGRRAARVRYAAGGGARDQGPHARPISISISRPMSAKCGRAAARCISRRRRRTPAPSCLRSAARREPSSSPRASPWCREEIGLNAASRGRRHRGGRDRSRRIYRAAAGRDAEPHHRPHHSPQQGGDRGGLPRGPPMLAQDAQLERAQRPRRRGACVLREKFVAADVGITGANLLIAETGIVGHRHQ